MTEAEAKCLKKGDRITYHGEECEVLRIHRSSGVLVECKTVNKNHMQWHMVKPGGCRAIT